jgi:DNA-binding transcriptional ArsR family regulator
MASRRVLTDIGALKALAHPLRQRMLTRLQQRGPATAADLAVAFGVDRGATSYHLRQLERFGFIEEDTVRSAGRRRFWRSVPQDLRLPKPGGDAEVDLIVGELDRQWRDRARRSQALFEARRQEYGAFADAAMSSHGTALLTAEELVRFGEEYIEFIQRWQRDPDTAPAGARPVTVLFHAFPTPDEEPSS